MNAHTYYFVVFYTGNMPRSKIKIKRSPIAKTALSSAIKLVKEKKFSLRGAAKHFNLSRSTLKRHYEHCLKTGKDASDLHDNIAVKKFLQVTKSSC